jgi:hypothetical protein
LAALVATSLCVFGSADALAANVAVRVVTSPALPPNIIRNGAFVNPVLTGEYQGFPAGSQAIPGWSVGGDGVVVFGPKYIEPPPGATAEVRLVSQRSGDIEQTIDTTSGWTYLLRFYGAGQPGGGQAVDTMHVFWDQGLVSTPTFKISGHSATNVGWSLHRLIVTGKSATSTLEFADVTRNTVYYGSMVGNISLAAIANLFVPTSLKTGLSGNLVAFVRSATGAPITDQALKVTLYGSFKAYSYAPPVTQELAAGPVDNGQVTLRLHLPSSLAGKTVSASVTMAGPEYITVTHMLTIKVV